MRKNSKANEMCTTKEEMRMTNGEDRMTCCPNATFNPLVLWIAMDVWVVRTCNQQRGLTTAVIHAEAPRRTVIYTEEIPSMSDKMNCVATRSTHCAMTHWTTIWVPIVCQEINWIALDWTVCSTPLRSHSRCCPALAPAPWTCPSHCKSSPPLVTQVSFPAALFALSLNFHYRTSSQVSVLLEGLSTRR